MVDGNCEYSFPFEVCKFCPNLSVDTNVIDIYGDGKIIGRKIAITCAKERICRDFYEMLEKDNDIVQKAVEDSQN